MPHRTVFQWGKNHAHPFTVFMGGLIIGALVTGVIMYSWWMADSINDEFESIIIVPTMPTETPTPQITPSESPVAETEVQF